MGFQEAIQKVFSNYVTFTGRASRSEFWWWALFTFLGGLAASLIDGVLFGFGRGMASPLNGLFSLAVLLPSIAVGVRRLHDIGRSGWWYLLIFIPVIGIVVLIYFWVQRSEAGANEHGAQPPEAEGFTA
jgi:Predicted membrane protein